MNKKILKGVSKMKFRILNNKISAPAADSIDADNAALLFQSVMQRLPDCFSDILLKHQDQMPAHAALPDILVCNQFCYSLYLCESRAL